MRSSGAGRDPLDRWPEFGAVVRKRLERGAAEYGDSALMRPASELTGEIAEELEDLAAWAYLLWRRVQGFEKAVSGGTAADEPARPSELLKADQVAQRLSLPKPRVYALAREGRIGGVVRLGSQIRFDSHALEVWIQAGGLPVSGDPLGPPPSAMPLSHTRRSDS